MTLSHEERFLSAITALDVSHRDISDTLTLLEGWLHQLTEDVVAHPVPSVGLQEHSALAGQIRAINTSLNASVHDWTQKWTDLEPAQTLADVFSGTLMLLVFGKFNAGKSSFCNFLAERLSAGGLAPTTFRISDGHVIDTDGNFAEGTTETTTQLQGVILGKALVLLDTPGLHSVTRENAALTQRFTDSADGVLWLTSSSSPGQVQELNELARELRRNKPLLPVITRSDIIDEDEVNGEIKKTLLNKTPDNRREQEDDVYVRASEKLISMQVDPGLLKPALSVSTHAARYQGQTTRAMEEAGFERLYAALTDMLEPAVEYKARKPAETLLHHLEENVQHSLRSELMPHLEQLHRALDAQHTTLDDKKTEIIKAAWRHVIPALPEMLEHHAPTGNVQAVCEAVTQLLNNTITRVLEHELADYDLTLDFAAAVFELDAKVNYEFPIQLHDELQAAVYDALEQQTDRALKACRSCIDQVAAAVSSLHDMLDTHARCLDDIKINAMPVMQDITTSCRSTGLAST